MFRRTIQHMMKELRTLAPSTLKIKDVFSDDDIITVAPNVSCCARVLTQPCFTVKTSQRSPRHFFLKCDVDIRNELYINVVFQRIFFECKTKEQTETAPSSMKIKLVVSLDVKHHQCRR